MRAYGVPKVLGPNSNALDSGGSKVLDGGGSKYQVAPGVGASAGVGAGAGIGAGAGAYAYPVSNDLIAYFGI